MGLLDDVPGGLPTLAGAAILGAGLIDPSPKRSAGLVLVGGAVAAAGVLRAATAFDVFGVSETLRLVREGKVDARGLWEGLKAVAGAGPEGELPGLPPFDPFAERKPPVADELGKPKNARKVVGKIMAPLSGSQLPSTGSTFPVDLAIENQSDRTQEGKVRIQLSESGRERITEGPAVSLEPGESQRATIRVQRLDSVPASRVASMLRFLWAGHLLDRVGFYRTNAVY